MDTKEMTVGETEPVTVEWLKGTMPSPPPVGLVAVVLTIGKAEVAEFNTGIQVSVLTDQAAPRPTIKAKAAGTTTITALGVTGPPGVPVPAITLDALTLTVREAPETYHGEIVIGVK